MIALETAELAEVSYAELNRHASDRSAWVSFEGQVYDITAYLHAHRQGRDILVPALGTDITSLFRALHRDPRVFFFGRDKRLRPGIHLVGRLVAEGRDLVGLHAYQARRLYPAHDPLLDELHSEVNAYLRTHRLSRKKSRRDAIGLLALFWGLYVTAMILGFVVGSPWWCLLLGPIATFMATNPAHTALHGGFSDSRLLDKLAALLLDAGGYSAFGWSIEHTNHHEAPHTRIDVQTFYSSVVRFFEHQEHRWYFRYQFLYLWPVFLLYTPSQFFHHSWCVLVAYRHCLTPMDRVLHVLVKGVFFVLPIALCFWLHPLPMALGLLFLFVMSTSYCSIFLLFIQHEDSYLPEDELEPWSVRQIRTASSWRSPSRVLQWSLGYFNYHTEHHLFPALNPALYPRIQPIVKQVCARHGVPYKDLSYPELVGSQLAAWRKFAYPPARSHS